jgi:pimeloyl-ACP methyl ester carboxylesterase
MTAIVTPSEAAEKIADLRARLLATRWPSYDAGGDRSLGVSSDDARRLVRYWANEFDFAAWRQRVAALPHEFLTIDDVSVHLVHVRSPHPHAVPVIITHGWPSTFLEIVPLIERLTQPERFGGRTEDACHLVIPSLPGFGFSSPPSALGGYTGAAIADLWARVMTSLGYERFFASGGDIGARVTSWLGVRHAQRVRAIHVSSNALRVALPGEAAATLDEQAYLDARNQWAAMEGGYMHVQQTKPLSLAYGLNDSPAGLVAWLGEKWFSWSDELNRATPEVMDIILGHATLYWMTNTIATSFLPYFVYDWPPGARVDGTQVKVPVGFYLSAAEIGGIPPESFARRQFEISRWSVLPRGGHFMATEEPELLTDDLLAFIRTFR